MKILSNKNLTRKHPYDAGIDMPLPMTVKLLPHQTTVIDLQIQVDIPRGMMGMLISRSSASKKGIITAMSPIDSGYTGHIHAIVTNTTDQTVWYLKTESICQLVVIPCVLADLCTEIEGDTRGAGAFGSTGK